MEEKVNLTKNIFNCSRQSASKGNKGIAPRRGEEKEGKMVISLSIKKLN